MPESLQGSALAGGTAAVATPADPPLVFSRDKSARPDLAGAHEPGCWTVGGAWLWPDGTAAPVRSKASNRCAGCARAVAFENMTMLRQDAEEHEAPGHVLTLTSRDPITDAGAYRQACASFWRAFRKRWGHVEYCGFVEWTTGDGPRSGGRRRLHSHWLVKGLRAAAGQLDAIEAWVRDEWRQLTGAWVVQLAALASVGGVVGYLALHHEKMEQAPPKGWTGRRLRPSRGYFSTSGRERRERARHWLQARRDEQEGREVPREAPKLVWGRTEAEKGALAVVAEPAPAVGLRRGRELHRQLEDPEAPANRDVTDEDVQRWGAAERRREALAAIEERRRLPDRERAVVDALAALR